MTTAPPRRPIGHVIRITIGYLIAIASLAWIFHDVKWEQLGGDMKAIRWRWIPPAIICDILSYAVQGTRWRLLLRPLGRLSLLRATQAVYAGLFASEVLPMRAGEGVRAYIVSRWIGVKVASVLPSLVVERFFDGIWLALYIGLAAVFIPLPRNLVRAADILGASLILLTILFLAGVLWSPRRRPADGEPIGRASRLVLWWMEFVSAVRGMATSRAFYLSFALTSLILILQGISFWFVMVSYGIPLGVLAGAVILLIVHFGTALPNAPGNIGSYQLFVVIGLALFGIDKTRATGFSMAVFVILTIPLWALGFLALAKSGVTVARVRREFLQRPFKRPDRQSESSDG